MKTRKPEFQFGDVVRFKTMYLFEYEESDEDVSDDDCASRAADGDDDTTFRAMVLGRHTGSSDLYWLVVLRLGADEEEIGQLNLMPGNMFDLDPKYTK